MDEAQAIEIFLDIQRGLPRQGPGSDAETRRALRHCRDLPPQPSILDIGCGPGMQTLVLADVLDGHVVAVDLHEEYLNELRARADNAGFSKRITPLKTDMNDLTYPPASLDLIWAEGSAYIMGVENALRSWKSLLTPNGYLGFTELVWLTDDRPPEPDRFFGAEYPPMKNVEANVSMIIEAGYRLIEHFTLSDNAWWDDYYAPLSRKLPELRAKYAGDDEALAFVAMTESEIEMRRTYGDCYGYEFFVLEVEAR